MRLDTVEELTGDPVLLHSLMEGLAVLPKDLDRLCHSMSMMPSSSGNVGKRCVSLVDEQNCFRLSVGQTQLSPHQHDISMS